MFCNHSCVIYNTVSFILIKEHLVTWNTVPGTRRYQQLSSRPSFECFPACTSRRTLPQLRSTEKYRVDNTNTETESKGRGRGKEFFLYTWRRTHIFIIHIQWTFSVYSNNREPTLTPQVVRLFTYVNYNVNIFAYVNHTRDVSTPPVLTCLGGKRLDLTIPVPCWCHMQLFPAQLPWKPQGLSTS